MIEPEMVVADGDAITVGDNSFTVIETPGHTWGTASYMYDVTDGDNTHRAITIRGLGLNAIEGPLQVETYIESVDRVRQLVETQGMPIAVHLTTQGFSANLDENSQKQARRQAGEPNVLVDPQALLNQVAGLRERAVKRLELEKLSDRNESETSGRTPNETQVKTAGPCDHSRNGLCRSCLC